MEAAGGDEDGVAGVTYYEEMVRHNIGAMVEAMVR